MALSKKTSHLSFSSTRKRAASRSGPFALVWAMLLTVVLGLSMSGVAVAGVADLAVEAHGLKGEYFRMSAPGARDFAELGGVSVDPQIDLPGLVATFESLTGQREHTTARWTGQVEVPASGDYTFYGIGDNGFRLFIDGKPVIDHWVPDWDVEQTSAPVTLTAGVRHDFRLEMFQDIGGANMFLRWSSATMNKQLVPESAFTPPADLAVYPVDLSVAEDGRRLEAAFAGAVTNLGDLAGHVVVEADTTPMPIESVALSADDPTTVVVMLGEPVNKGARVRVSYDGVGGLEVAGAVVPQIIRNATNSSTHRLLTEWGEKLDAANPLPEYPRPQQVREKWLNLNGPWEFAAATEAEQPVFGTSLAEKIVVPFPVESQLSGLERHEDHMFYRKLVSVPAAWRIGAGQRLKLNFGAVDYRAKVWVNGQLVAEHTGGYTSFSADITAAVRGPGEQEIVVAVTDTTGDNQPVGKQSRNPSGIFYTPSSGIWQTVWMEPVPDVAIDELVTTPDITAKTLAVQVKSASASPAAVVTATARDAKGKEVGAVTGPVNSPLVLPIKKQHLWTPDDPYLYDLTVTLAQGSAADSVASYFGMRSVGVEKVGDYQKLVLNGKPVFSLAMLDQGFWPDGLNTAPSDEALRFDLQAQKDLGFNAVRKHIKVEPARWYHHADQLGLLVWQDFVSGHLTTEAGQEQFLAEGRAEMAQLHNSPSIIGWIPFNEGWGEWNREATGLIAESVKAADPSRVVNAQSGVNCCDSKGDSGKGDIIDHHDYMNREAPFPDATRAAMDGEHGGFTLRTPGHLWPGAPAAIYSGVADKAALTAKYVSNTETFYLAQAGAELSGSVYTQVTDLENELNGMLTYDRRVSKVDTAQVRAVNERVIAAGANAGDVWTFPGIKGIHLGDVSQVRQNLVLPGGDADTTVAWTSSDHAVLTDTGVLVRRPEVGEPGAPVTLTLSVTEGAATATREFAVTVAAWTAQEMVFAAGVDLATGFEAGQPQAARNQRLSSTNVGEFCCGIGGMETVGGSGGPGGTHSGDGLLLYSGSAEGEGPSSASSVVVPAIGTWVKPGAALSYWVYPESGTGRTSQFVALDLLFTDGTYLRDLGATANNGAGAHPAQQGTVVQSDQWQQVTINVGDVAAGKQVQSVVFSFDSAAENGPFRGMVDDLVLDHPASVR